MAVEECLTKKGYEFEPPLTVGEVLLTIAIIRVVLLLTFNP